MSDVENDIAEAEVERELTAEQEAELREIFDEIDQNGDEHIEASEFVEALRGMGENPTDEEAQEALKSMDKTNDDVVSFDEFRKFILANPPKSEEERKKDLKEAFDHFDKNKDGFVRKSELKEALCKGDKGMSEDEVNEFFKLADENEDGKISIEEFTDHLLELSGVL